MAAAAGATASAATDWPYKKVTLIKPLVGRVRMPSFPLPGPAHVYGARVQKDNETAATLLSNWTTTAAATVAPASAADSAHHGEGKAAAAAQQSWIRSNILALKHGNLTARAQRAFAKRHPSITVPLKRVIGTTTQGAAAAAAAGPDAPSTASRAQALAAAGFVFGRATPRNADTAKDVVGGRFNPKALEAGPDYPARIVAVLSARLPKPRPTRSSRLLKATHEAQVRRRAEQGEAARTGVPPGGPLWTMQRWRNAVAKVKTGGSGMAAPVAAAV